MKKFVQVPLRRITSQVGEVRDLVKKGDQVDNISDVLEAIDRNHEELGQHLHGYEVQGVYSNKQKNVSNFLDKHTVLFKRVDTPEAAPSAGAQQSSVNEDQESDEGPEEEGSTGSEEV